MGPPFASPQLEPGTYGTSEAIFSPSSMEILRNTSGKVVLLDKSRQPVRQLG
jgi:hypothetical protein